MAFHVKDAEFISNARCGVYGSYQNWEDRPRRFRLLGDGQIDFKSIFSKLTQYGLDGRAVLEWPCCIKHPENGAGAKEGMLFIQNNLIRPADKAFDDFTRANTDIKRNNRILGIS
jgi:sugar phosphate isomerase/epimerase